MSVYVSTGMTLVGHLGRDIFRLLRLFDTLLENWKLRKMVKKLLKSQGAQGVYVSVSMVSQVSLGVGTYTFVQNTLASWDEIAF